MKGTGICKTIHFHFSKLMVIGATGVPTAAVAAHVEEEQNTGTDRVTTQVHSMVEFLVLDHPLIIHLAIGHLVQVKKKKRPLIGFIQNYVLYSAVNRIMYQTMNLFAFFW